MKCPYDSRLICYKIWRTGKGLWNWSSELCASCEVFLKARQTPLGISMKGKKESKDWIKKRLEEANAKRKEDMAKKGYAEFYTFPVGETTISVNIRVEPREKEGDFGTQAIFRITVKGDREEKDFSVSLKSPLYRQLLENASEGKTHLTIVRTGEGKETRYTIKKAWSGTDSVLCGVD